MNVKAIKRSDYPQPNADDFINAVEDCLANESDASHYKRGRYTAHRWRVEPMPDMKPGEKLECVIVEACERDIVAIIPVEQADDLLSAIKSKYDNL